MRKNILFIAILLLILLPANLNAQVRFNEVMYDLDGTDSGREWIEIFNGSTEEIDLNTWKLFENNVAHKISNEVNSILKPNEFGVIADNPAKFLIDYPNFGGLLLDSAFSLNNSGEELILQDETGQEIDKVGYNPELGANGTGNSLQFSNNVWIPAEPTPGELNKSIPSNEKAEDLADENNSVDSSNNESSHSLQEVLTKEKEDVVLKIGAGRKRQVSINTPIEFRAIKGDKFPNKVKFIWVYGDGSSGMGGEVEHTYKYEGRYNVVLNAYYKDKRAVTRTVVDVKKPELELKVKEGLISLINSNSYEVNIGGFYLKHRNTIFTFPEDTILSSGQVLVLDKEITGISYDIGSLLELRYPNNKLSSIYMGNLSIDL